jgi:hypothetical protein
MVYSVQSATNITATCIELRHGGSRRRRCILVRVNFTGQDLGIGQILIIVGLHLTVILLETNFCMFPSLIFADADVASGTNI